MKSKFGHPAQITLIKIMSFALVSATLIGMGLSTQNPASAQMSVGECMQDAMRRGISERSAVLACRGQQSGVSMECVKRMMYKTYTATSRYDDGEYFYSEVGNLPDEYRRAAGCSSGNCKTGPKITVQVRSEEQALSICQGNVPIR